MNKTILLAALLIFALPLVSAAQPGMCEDTREINQNCTMVTPVTSCSTYNYTIINLTGEKVVESDLVFLNDSIYYFNLTVGPGDYVIRLCDNTTRQIRVKERDDNNMILGAIIIAPLLLGLFLILAAASLGQQHNALRIFLFLLGPILFFTSLHFAMESLVHFYDIPGLENAIGTTTYWTGWVLAVIIMYFLIYLLTRMFNSMANKRKEETELRYD